MKLSKESRTVNSENDVIARYTGASAKDNIPKQNILSVDRKNIECYNIIGSLSFEIKHKLVVRTTFY